ncbi:MAG: hypothetical protein FWG56_10970 [Desulfovibrionaceae bacterium]|nr:hypothetical protein [Desulfovibrionaceae bacterium]
MRRALLGWFYEGSLLKEQERAATRGEFAALLEAQDLMTDAGRRAYAALLALAPQFDQAAQMLDELARAAAGDLIATYTRAAAVAPGMQIARDAMAGAASQAQALGGSFSVINKILGDASSGVLRFGGAAGGVGEAGLAAAAQLTAAQQAALGLEGEMFDLQAAASGTVLNIGGLAKALQGLDTSTWVASITSAFALIGQRISDELGAIAGERIAVREAAIGIIGPAVMTPDQISAQIAAQTTALPGQGGIAAAQTALAKADAGVAAKEAALAAAKAASGNTGQGYLDSAAALEAARGNAARNLVATYLRHGNVQNGIKGETVPASLAALATYEDTQASMLSKLARLPTADIQAFADQLTRLSASGLRPDLVSTSNYLNMLAAYNKSTADEAANQAKARTLRAQAADLAAKATAAEKDLATARAAQTAAAGNAQKAQLDYVAALQKYSLDGAKAVASLGKLREETVAYYQSQAQLAQTMNTSASGLRQTVQDIRFGQLDTAAQFAVLQERYNVAYSMAMSTTGQTLAGYGDEMAALLGPLLQKAQDAGLGGAGYASLVNTLLARAEAIAGRLDAGAPASYQQDSLGLLGQIDSTLAALEAGAKTSEQILAEAIKAGTDTTRDGLRAVIAALQGKAVPAFAAGGLHGGGLRLVGEHGPELEVTGPARYFSAAQTQRLLSALGGDAAILHELQQLRRELAQLRAERRADAGATAANTGRTRRLLDRIAEDGLPVRNAGGQRLDVAVQEAARCC